MSVDHDMFTLSWYYMYGVGGLIYLLGVIAGLKTGVLDLSIKKDRNVFVGMTACLVLFAGVHALFQFVLPASGQGG